MSIVKLHGWEKGEIPPLLDSCNWEEAFGYCGEPGTFGSACIESAYPNANVELRAFSRADVKYIHAMDQGDNDGPPWIICGTLWDGRSFFLEAGCDYTGWG